MSDLNTHRLTRETAATLFLQNIDFIRSVAFENAPNRSLQEDIVHDVYICLIENVDKWKYDENKKLALLRSITEKMSARYWRSYIRNLPKSLRELAEKIQAQKETGILNNRKNENEKILALKHCLEKLSEPNRQLIEMIYFGQKNYTELTQETSKSLSALYTQMSRIRDSLYHCIERKTNSEEELVEEGNE